MTEVVTHAVSPTPIGQLAGVPGTLCPCTLIPSQVGATHSVSPRSMQLFLCLFVLSYLLRVDVIRFMLAPRHQGPRVCNLFCIYTARMLNSVG